MKENMKEILKNGFRWKYIVLLFVTRSAFILFISIHFFGCTENFATQGDVKEVVHDGKITPGTIFIDKVGVYYTYIYSTEEKKAYITVEQDVKHTNYNNLPEEITIPETITVPGGMKYIVKYIGDNAFKDCKKIKKVRLSNNITEIFDSAFYKSSIQEIIWSNSVKQISTKCFYGCDNLKNIEIPSSILRICDMAFSKCNNLETVTIANTSQLIIDMPAFSDCPKLTTLNFNAKKSVTYGSPPYFPTVKTLNIGDFVEVVPKNTFNNCYELVHLKIGSSVNSIESYAFWGCRKLEKVYCKAYYPPIIQNEAWYVTYFNPTNHWITYLDNGIEKKVILSVPKGSQMLYVNSAGWNEFYTIIEE